LLERVYSESVFKEPLPFFFADLPTVVVVEVGILIDTLPFSKKKKKELVQVCLRKERENQDRTGIKMKSYQNTVI
jgi:hypothetical protein